MLLYFRISETHHGISRDFKQHGYEGPLHTTPIPNNHPKRLYPLREPLRQAWGEAGVKYVGDGTYGQSLGLTDLEEAWIRGKRQFPIETFDLSRVQVLAGTLVHRVNLERKNGDLVATGVKLMNGDHISSTREIIVSAGVYHAQDSDAIWHR
jgi:hypothetical protein